MIERPYHAEDVLQYVFRLIDTYDYSPEAPTRFDDAFGHNLPVELRAGPIERWDSPASDALRSTTGILGRQWRIRPYGDDVERLVARGTQ
jgi:hypothetical protein